MTNSSNKTPAGKTSPPSMSMSLQRIVMGTNWTLDPNERSDADWLDNGARRDATSGSVEGNQRNIAGAFDGTSSVGVSSSRQIGGPTPSSINHNNSVISRESLFRVLQDVLAICDKDFDDDDDHHHHDDESWQQ